MMQSSDYCFLDRSVRDVYVWIWFVIHVWKCDRFASLKFSRIFSMELKSFVTLFILFAIPLESFYDIVLTKIKYTEAPYSTQEMWSYDNLMWINSTYYTLMVGFGFQTCTLFLLQCFWNYLSNSIAKTSFMSGLEFKFYIAWSILALILFPTLQFVFRNDIILREVVPQLAYGIQLFLVFLLSIKTHLRFTKLIQESVTNKNATRIISKLRYFVDMNKSLTICLLITSVSILALTIDNLADLHFIYNNRVASEIFLAHVNFTTTIEWVVLVLIFYPRKGSVGTDAGYSSNSTVNSVSQFSPSKLLQVPATSTDALTTPDKHARKSRESTLLENHSIRNSTPVMPTLPPASVVAASIPSNAPLPLLKRNISISKDGKMIYGETKPLGKVRGSEFVAVEKADPSVLPSYYFMGEITDLDGVIHPMSSISSNIEKSVVSQQSQDAQQDNSNSSQGERMLMLQRQHDEFKALNMAAKSQESAGNDVHAAGLMIKQQQQISSDISDMKVNINRSSDVASYISIEDEDDDDDDEYFYAM